MKPGTMGIRLREGDFDAFFEAPFSCYGRDAVIASPLRGDLRDSLDPRKNPLLQQGRARLTWFTAHRAGRTVGRIVAHVHDASNRLHGLTRGYFGMFDCIDDIDVARALIDRASEWLSVRGCSEIAGAFNLTVTQLVGVVTDGFEHAPYTYQDWSPAHVPRLLDALGLERFYPMRTFELDLARVDLPSLLGAKQQALLDDPDWRFARIGRRDLQARLLECCTILNDGFANNPMFVPLSNEEFVFPCAGLTAVIDERLSCIAYYRGEPAGAFLSIPDLTGFLHATGYRLGWKTPWLLWRLKRRRDRSAGVFYSVCRRFHNLGVNGVMLNRVCSDAREAGYTTMGVSWISDGNAASLRQMEKLGATPLHRLHLFRRPLP